MGALLYPRGQICCQRNIHNLLWVKYLPKYRLACQRKLCLLFRESSVNLGQTRPCDENPETVVTPPDPKDKDTGFSPPLGSRKVTFLDSPPSPPLPAASPQIKRRSLSPESRVQERLTPPESEQEQKDRKQAQPWPSSRRRTRALDPSQRLQNLGPSKDESNWGTDKLRQISS